MCDDVEAGKKVELSDAKSSIERQIRSERSEESIKAMIEKVKKEYPVTYNEDYFKNAGQGPAQAMPEAGMPPVSPVQPVEPKQAK